MNFIRYEESKRQEYINQKLYFVMTATKNISYIHKPERGWFEAMDFKKGACLFDLNNANVFIESCHAFNLLGQRVPLKIVLVD